MSEDFILNPDGDFPLQDTIISGFYIDTPYGQSDNQHLLDLIQYEYGDLKETPVFGFGVNKYLNSEVSTQIIEGRLNQELVKDGYYSNNGVVQPNQKSGFTILTQYINSK